MKYNIFAGLSGGFGGANYYNTEEFDTVEEAEENAYEIACEKYDNMAGLHGLESYEHYVEEAQLDLDEDDYENEDDFDNAVQEYAEEAYNEDRESWLDYYVIPETDPKFLKDDEE